MKRFRKAGIFFLVMVITLAGIGGALAAWTDHIQVTGTVATGSVEYEVIGYSGTAVLKPNNSHGIVVIDNNYDGANGWCCEWKPEDPPFNNAAWNSFDGHELVAYACAGPGNDGIDMVWWNIFPAGDGFQFTANFEIEYTGTVPARVQGIDYQSSANPPAGITMDWTVTHTGSSVTVWDWEALQNGPSLEKGDKIKVEVTITADPDRETMGLGHDPDPLEGTVTITLVQWNCYQD